MARPPKTWKALLTFLFACFAFQSTQTRDDTSSWAAPSTVEAAAAGEEKAESFEDQQEGLEHSPTKKTQPRLEKKKIESAV